MKLKASDKVMLPLCDHIAGAVERYRQNVKLENPMLWVVKYIYPKEFKTGRYAVRRIEEMTGIRMLDDEAAFLAYHFVIEELGNDDQTNAETMSKIVRDILHIVEQSFQIELNPEDWNYERFLTHLKFFVNRIIERKTYEDSEDQSLYEEMKARFPKVHRCVERIADYILGVPLSGRSALGAPGPSRTPRPAAGITAAVRRPSGRVWGGSVDIG